MPQISPLDAASLMANRASMTNARKGNTGFEEAFAQAERQVERPVEPEQNRAPKEKEQDSNAPAADEPRSEQNGPTKSGEPQPKPTQAEAPKTEEAPAPKQEQPSEDPAPVAEQPSEAPTETVNAEAAAAQAAAEAARAAAAKAAVEIAPVQSTEIAEEAETVTTVAAAVSTEVEGETKVVTPQPTEAAEEADASKAQAFAHAAEAAKAKVAEQASAQAQSRSQGLPAQVAAQAGEQAAQTPVVAQAASELGKITMQVSQEKPTAPAVPVKTEKVEGFANLAMQAIEQQAKQESTVGSITQVAVSDGADEGVETAPLPVNLLADEADAASTDAEAPEATVTATQGDRPTAEGGKIVMRGDAPPPPARADEVVSQLLKQAEQLKSQQQNSIKLQLYPEHLGKMEIKVVSHQGVLSAQLTADSHQVKSLLENQVAMLQRSFAELGLKVDKVEVTLASADLNFEGGGQQAGGQESLPQQHQQRQQADRLFASSGYTQWLGEDPVEEEAYAYLGESTSVDYVA